MKRKYGLRLLSFIFAIIILLLSVSCEKAPSLKGAGLYKQNSDGDIIDPNGNIYEFVGTEGNITVFGTDEFISGVEGEKKSFKHLGLDITTGMYGYVDDDDRSVLKRYVPDCEFASFYRKKSLPRLDLSVENCVRFEFVDGLDENIAHLSCGEGIIGKSECNSFLEDIYNQQTAKDAGLYESVKGVDGQLVNCYQKGVVYGFFEEEPSLAIEMRVMSFNDKAYSIEIDGTEYVLPVEWISKL